MKEGWEYSTIGDLCDKMNGLWKGKIGPFVNVGVIRNANFTKAFTLSFDNIEYLDVEVRQYKTRKLIKGDLIVEKSGGSEKQPVGRTVLFDKATGEYSFSNFTSVLRIKDRNIISPEFLYKYILFVYLRGDTRKMQKATTGIHNIEFDKFLSIPVPLLPLSEQQSIVDYLDSAFAKIDAMKANAEKALNEAKAFFQASLKDMLEPKEDIKWSTIGELFDTYSGGTPNKSNKEYYEGGSIPWLRSGEVCQKDITQTEMFITEKGLKDSSAKYYPENTVVVAMYGATAAQVGILRIKATSNQAVCGILPNKEFTPEFVYYWFSSIEDKLAAQAQGGAQPNISQQKIKRVEMPIYSINKQQSIVSILDTLKSKVDSLQANFDKISQECNALKQAILRQVFE